MDMYIYIYLYILLKALKYFPFCSLKVTVPFSGYSASKRPCQFLVLSFSPASGSVLS